MATHTQKKQAPQADTSSSTATTSVPQHDNSLAQAQLGGFAEGVTGTEMFGPEGELTGVWLESESFTGNLDLDDYEAGRAVDFPAHQKKLDDVVVSPSLSVLTAVSAFASVMMYDGEEARTFVDDAVEHLEDSETALSETAEVPKVAEDAWWAAGAIESGESFDGLTEAVAAAREGMGGILVFPGTEGRWDLDDEGLASEATAERGGVLAGFADWAAELMEEADGYTELPVRKSKAKAMAASLSALDEDEQDYLYEAVIGTEAHPLWLGELAQSMGRPMPSCVGELFENPEAAVAVWNGDDKKMDDLSERGQELMSTQLVLDLAAWTAGDMVTKHDLQRFEWYLSMLGLGRLTAPRIEGTGLTEALMAAIDLREPGGDPEQARKRMNAAFAEIDATYGELPGCDAVLDQIEDHRAGLERIAAGREAEALIERNGGNDEIDTPMSVGEQIAFKQVRKTAQEVLASRRDLESKLAEMGDKGLAAVGGADKSMPTHMGGVALKTVIAIAAAGDLKAQREALAKANKGKKDEDKKGTDEIEVAKLHKAAAEVLGSFLEGVLRYSGSTWKAMGMAEDAARLFKAADLVGEAFGTFTNIMGLAISVAELSKAIREGDPDKIAAASAGLAQSIVGTAEFAGLISVEAAGVLNILVIEAFAVYEIAKGLPAIARRIHQVDVMDQSKDLATFHRTSMKHLKRAQAAYAALAMGDLEQAVAHRLADKCYDAMAGHVAAVKDSFATIGEMPYSMRRAFDGQLNRVSSRYSNKGPSKDKPGAAFTWCAGISTEAPKLKRAMEDVQLEARVEAGDLTEVGAAVERGVLEGQRAVEDAR